MWKVVASFANRRVLSSGGYGHGKAFTTKANKILQQIAQANDAEKKRQREEMIEKDREIEARFRAGKAKDKAEKRRVKEMRKEKKEWRKMEMISKLTGKATVTTTVTKEFDISTVTKEVAISAREEDMKEVVTSTTTVTKKEVAISTTEDTTEEVVTSTTTVTQKQVVISTEDDAKEVETPMMTVVKEVTPVETTSEKK